MNNGQKLVGIHYRIALLVKTDIDVDKLCIEIGIVKQVI